MNKQELLDKIDLLIEDAKVYQSKSEADKDNLNTMYYIGEQMALFNVKIVIQRLKD